MDSDSYKTIAGAAQAVSRERGSRFLAFAWPVEEEGQVKEHLDHLRKTYHDATHHCYAWRMGPEGELTRSSDDGEPSATAGKPILGQLLSAGLTDVLVVVVRYFGGTKLGVPGLIGAYREAARGVIEAAQVVEKRVEVSVVVEFPYRSMNAVMRVVKELEPRVVSQDFNVVGEGLDNVCRMRLAIRRGLGERLLERLRKCEGVEVEVG